VTTTYWPDTSKWQGVISSFSAVHAHRIDSGVVTDSTWGATYANAQQANKRGELRLLIGYVVYRPGQEAAITARVRSAMGGSCPKWVGFMIDMESGAQFAGPGEHSAGANKLVSLLAEFSGRGIDAVCGYANGSDWASCWSTRPSGLKRIVARYSSSPPAGDWWGWQYSDGSATWPLPEGAMFASGRDMNMTHRALDRVLTDFAVHAAAPREDPITITEGDDMPMILRATDGTGGDYVFWPGSKQAEYFPKPAQGGTRVGDVLAADYGSKVKKVPTSRIMWHVGAGHYTRKGF
jgi:hypothetical protein